MRYFMDFPVERAELENLEHSSRNDESVIRSTMPKAREVARQIAAEGHVIFGLDIAAQFNINQLRDAIRRVEGPRSRVEASQVMAEWDRAGVLEALGGGQVQFKYMYGKLLQKMGEAHNLPLHAMWPTGPGDFEDNPGGSTKPWRGNKAGGQRERPFEPRDPDYMDNF